jgi:phosphatidylinositol-3-phosphatase
MTRNLALASTLLVACSSNSGAAGDDTHPDAPGMTHDAAPNDATITPIDGPPGSHPLTVFTILMENHDYKEIVGSSDAPYVNSLIAQGGLATNYKDSGTHPSLPNYLYLISGATQYIGFVDLDPIDPPFPVNKPNLGTQLEAAAIKWRSYQESASTACNKAGSGNYAPKHDPFLYFTDQVTGASAPCAATNVDFSNFAADLATDTYRYMWITPNLADDGHDPSTDPTTALTTSDTWLKNHVPAILASDAFKNNGVLFITWDEAEGRNGDNADQVPMIILSSRLKAAGMTSATAFTHASYLATVEDLLGLPRLATVTSAPSMQSTFLTP